jgi:hypothetical protein
MPVVKTSAASALGDEGEHVVARSQVDDHFILHHIVVERAARGVGDGQQEVARVAVASEDHGVGAVQRDGEGERGDIAGGQAGPGELAEEHRLRFSLQGRRGQHKAGRQQAERQRQHAQHIQPHGAPRCRACSGG